MKKFWSDFLEKEKELRIERYFIIYPQKRVENVQNWHSWVAPSPCKQVPPSLTLWALSFCITPCLNEGEREVAQSCPTLCDPVDYNLLDFSVHGILQARILEWSAISFSRGSSQPRNRIQVSCTGGRRFNLWATREAQWKYECLGMKRIHVNGLSCIAAQCTDDFK